MSKKSMVFERTDYVIGLFDWNDWKLRRESLQCALYAATQRKRVEKSRGLHRQRESVRLIQTREFQTGP